MRIVWNILLGIFSVLCIAALLLQGFALPAFSPALLLLLRFGGAFFAQWLFFRASQKKWVRFLPLFLTTVASVWGFFLFLTSPSWQNATFGHFVADYFSLFLSCIAFFFLRWLLPRLLPRLKRGIVLLFTRRKRKKASKQDMPRFR